MSTSFYRTLFALVIGALVGYQLAIGFYGVPTSQPKEEASGLEASTPQGESGLSHHTSDDQTSALDRVFEGDSTFSQTVRLYEILSEADERTLLELAHQAMALPERKDRDLVHEAVFRKLASIDPMEAISRSKEFLPRDQILRAIFEEWFSNEPESAVSYASTKPEPVRALLLAELISRRWDLTREQLREIAVQLNLERKFERRFSTRRLLTLVEDPRAEWHSVIQDDDKTEYQAAEELSHIAWHWIKQEGIEVILDIIQSTEGTPYQEDLQLWAFRIAVEEDGQRAFELANSLSDIDNEGMIEVVLAMWANTDSTAALVAVNEIEDDDVRRRSKIIVEAVAQNRTRIERMETELGSP